MTTWIYSKEHKRIVEKLKVARNEVGYNQKMVAKLLWKSQSYVSKVEAGQRNIDIVEIKNFAEIYKKDITYFIFHLCK